MRIELNHLTNCRIVAFMDLQAMNHITNQIKISVVVSTSSVGRTDPTNLRKTISA